MTADEREAGPPAGSGAGTDGPGAGTDDPREEADPPREESGDEEARHGGGRHSAAEWAGSEKEELVRGAVPTARDTQLPVKGGEGEAQTPSFRTPYPTSYGRPDRWRLKSAYWSYVLGHDRGWDAERKRASGDARAAERDRERLRRPPEAGASAAGDEAGEGTPGLAGGMGEDVPEATASRSRYGVPIPENLSFHRGPDTWRDRIEGLRPATGRPEETRRGGGGAEG